MTANLPRYALTLTEAVESIAEDRLRALDLADAQLARIGATDAAIEAWQFLDPAYARAQAQKCDALRGDGQLAGIGIGPLAGIGIGVKDIIATSDMPTTMGSAIFAGHRPAADATCVSRLRAAGGYVFGKTVTTAFAFMDPHKTRNPWDPAYSPGGSSSGSAAAVAAGHVTAALGTQTNGSVVRPAAYCGVVGFKPTLDAIAFTGVYQFSPTFDTAGCLRARSRMRRASPVQSQIRVVCCHHFNRSRPHRALHTSPNIHGCRPTAKPTRQSKPR